MATRKTQQRQPAKPRRAAAPAGPGAAARLKQALGALRHASGALSTNITHALFGLLVIGAVVGWLTGRESLRNSVAAINQIQPTAEFQWPLAPGAADTDQTWLPATIRADLADIALAGVSPDPFDQASLEESRRRLEATGWFSSITAVRRLPGGVIAIDGAWRTPVAVVRHAGREHLVARGGEILRLPPGVPVSPGSMPVILGPYALPPTSVSGAVECGKAWPGGDVQDALALLATLRARPGFQRIVGVELYDYMKTGHLTLISDTGARFVWGSAIGRSAPGEASSERRLANLKSILDERRDAPGYRYEIYTPYVLVDTTMARD